MIAYVKIFLHILCFTLIHTFQELINCKSDVKISMKVCPKKSRFLLFFFFPLLATKKSESEKRFPWKKMPGHRKENAYTEEKSDAEKKFLFQISVFIRTPERKERNYFLVAEEKRRKPGTVNLNGKNRLFVLLQWICEGWHKYTQSHTPTNINSRNLKHNQENFKYRKENFENILMWRL